MNDAAASNEAEKINTAPEEDDGWEWARVEIFGHREHYGRCREVERFGTKMLRVDVPLKGDPATHGWATLHYGGSSIFSYAITDEATVMKKNKPYEPSYPMISRSPEPEEVDVDDPDDRDMDW